VLGVSFLKGQWTVWRDMEASGFSVASSPSSSFVYLLTGTHGVHLLGGIFALLSAGATVLFRRAGRIARGGLGRDRLVLAFHDLLWVYILCLLEFAR